MRNISSVILNQGFCYPLFIDQTLFRYFQSLLDEPNPNSPANNVAAQLYQENRREYEMKVKVIVEESWISIPCQ